MNNYNMKLILPKEKMLKGGSLLLERLRNTHHACSKYFGVSTFLKRGHLGGFCAILTFQGLQL